MGCSRSAISNDEDDWYDFKKRAEVPAGLKLDMYSVEAGVLKKLHAQFGLRGDLLVEALDICNLQYVVDKTIKAEKEERELYLKLKAKFEK